MLREFSNHSVLSNFVIFTLANLLVESTKHIFIATLQLIQNQMLDLKIKLSGTSKIYLAALLTMWVSIITD